MPTRTITVTRAGYVDEGGALRYGKRGEVVEVHADHLARFDSLNGATYDNHPVIELVFEPSAADAVETDEDGDTDPTPPAPVKRTRSRKAT